ncbi:hypothetical protein LTR95_012827 [Oleoguttula sp. CCFEE 5521]
MEMTKDLEATSSAVAHSPQFSKLSGELRNRVWNFAVCEDGFIDITFTGVPEPGLLTACRLIREEAGGMYYYLNKFSVVCAGYNSAALLIANRKFEIFKVARPDKQTYSITLDGTPSWTNLVIWLERIHAGRLSCPALDSEDAEIDIVALHGAFRTAAGLRGVSWPKVEALLIWQQAVFVKIDPAWGKEQTAEE